MGYPSKYYSNKATVSWEGKRAEVYGKTAEIVNVITVITAIIGSAIYLNKIIKYI